MSHFKELPRRKSRRIYVRDVPIGDGAPITVQSMTTTDPHDVPATVKQILALEEAGCELVRITIPDYQAAEAIAEIKKQTKIPLIADIHFNHKLALESMKYGIDALRLNPGNVDDPAKVGKVCDEAKARGIPIRIGVNSGSLPLDIVEKYGEPTPEGMAEAAFRHIDVLEKHGFRDYKVSVKSTHVRTMIEAYRILAKATDAPLHLGLTEAGMRGPGSIKSAMAIGALLVEGIGDTIRVSLTGEPTQEVGVGFEILKGELRSVNFISDSGRVRTNWNCAQCGSFMVAGSDPRLAPIKPNRVVAGGTLDDSSWLQPTTHYWVSKKKSWIALPVGDTIHDTQDY